MSFRLKAALACVPLLMVTVGAGAAGARARPAAASTAFYIVQVAGAPLASYQGGEAGYAATKPAPGHRLDAQSTTAQAYRGYLRDRQTAVLRSAGVDVRRAVYRYETAFNGVAVQLTAVQARSMARIPGVLQVFKSRIVTVQTPVTPRFVGLTGPAGVWKRQFGGDRDAGNGVIIADID